jgi:hypothetical protein
MSTVDYGILAPAWAATGAADLVDDNALLTAMLATEVALAEAQAELGVIPADAAAASSPQRSGRSTRPQPSTCTAGAPARTSSTRR